VGVALMPGAVIDAVDRACAAGKCEESINLLERAVQSRPSDFRLHYRLGQCYSGCCRPHPLVHPDMAVPFLRQALRLLGSDTGVARAAVLEQLGNTLIERVELPAAIDCHLAAAEIYRSLDMLEDWARVEFNLGNSYCELSEATAEDYWQEAISDYEKSLQVRTLKKDPGKHAAILENLGTAFRHLPGQEAKSIQCYRRALRIYTPAANAGKCAALHNNLGNAFLALPATEAEAISRNARRALRHFDRALDLLSDQPQISAYGIAQHNRGQAQKRMARALDRRSECRTQPGRQKLV